MTKGGLPEYMCARFSKRSKAALEDPNMMVGCIGRRIIMTSPLVNFTVSDLNGGRKRVGLTIDLGPVSKSFPWL